MKKGLLTKFLSLFLVLTLLVGSLYLFSCGETTPTPENPGTNPPDEAPGEGSYLDKVIVPPIKEYDRKTINFSDIVYSRPNLEALCEAFEAITISVKEGASPDSVIERIEALEGDFNNALTMRSLANINNYKDTSVSFWGDEVSYITTSFPSFAQKVEDLFVAAAQSSDAEYYEENYFGEGLIEKYSEGGDYTDALVALLASEAKLESDYNSISTATVEITYLGETKTAEEFMTAAKNKYGDGTTEYLKYYNVYASLYTTKSQNLAKDIYIELIKIRRNIADEVGVASYYDYAFESMGHEYTTAEASAFLSAVSEYVVEVYTSNPNSLAPYLYSYYFNTTSADRLSLDKLVNGGYYALQNSDEELFEIYQYMLQFSLFDINAAESNRYQGAFTTYLDSYEAPFLFVTAGEFTTDYMTLFHEFGHFAEFYSNGNSNISLDLQEVFSEGLSLLMLENLKGQIPEEQIKYLSVKALCNALETLLFQGFYARFEQLVYALPEGRINEGEITALMKQAASEFGLNPDAFTLAGGIIPHIVNNPSYVISYCTSVVSALEIYLLELEREGAGFEAYKALLNREKADVGFIEALDGTSLSSPFEKDLLKSITNEIYCCIMGSYFYEVKAPGAEAA